MADLSGWMPPSQLASARLAAALKARFGSPQAALRALGLDQELLDQPPPTAAMPPNSAIPMRPAAEDQDDDIQKILAWVQANLGRDAVKKLMGDCGLDAEARSASANRSGPAPRAGQPGRDGGNGNGGPMLKPATTPPGTGLDPRGHPPAQDRKLLSAEDCFPMMARIKNQGGALGGSAFPARMAYDRRPSSPDRSASACFADFDRVRVQ